MHHHNNVAKQTFRQSNIICRRTFKSWYYEFKQLCESLKSISLYLDNEEFKGMKFRIDRDHAEMYYNGGYSPKMVFLEINKIPVNVEIF